MRQLTVEDEAEFAKKWEQLWLTDWEPHIVFWVAHGKLGTFWFTTHQAKNLRKWYVSQLARRYDLWHVFPARRPRHLPASYVLHESRVADAGRDQRAGDVALVPVRLVTISARLAAAIMAADDPQAALLSRRELVPARRVSASTRRTPIPPALPEWAQTFSRKRHALLRLLWGKGEVSITKLWPAIWGNAVLSIDTLHTLVRHTNKQLVSLVPGTTGITYAIRVRRGEVVILEAAQ